MFESEFEWERVFPNFRSSRLTSFFLPFFRNVWKIWNFQSSGTSKILQKLFKFLALENAETFQFCHFWSDLNQKSQKLAIFGPIWTQFRSKERKIWPGSHFLLI